MSPSLFALIFVGALAVLMPAFAFAPFQCPQGSQLVDYGGGWRCRCPDGSWASINGCPAHVPSPFAMTPGRSYEPLPEPSPPKESLLVRAFKMFEQQSYIPPTMLPGNIPLSSALGQRAAPPLGYSDPFAGWRPPDTRPVAPTQEEKRYEVLSQQPDFNPLSGRVETDQKALQPSPKASEPVQKLPPPGKLERRGNCTFNSPSC